MRNRSASFALLVLCTGTLTQAQTPVSSAFAQALQHKLDSCVNAYDVPGISATLLLSGDRYWNGASGVADIYSEAPMDTAYLFQAASMTKLFTAAVIFQLVDEGSLSLDDTVGAFLPPMTYVPANIKVRHLLKHRSGLAEFLADPDAANSWLFDPLHDWDPFDVLETFGAAPTFSQGAAFEYSNTNYLLLGMIVESITGLPYSEALRTRILDPLGLAHTAFRPDEALPGPLVPGWSSLSAPNTYDEDMTDFLGPCFSSMAFTAGAMVTTPWDMARFNRALFTGAVLPAALMDTMRVCTSVSMGSGCNGYGFGTMRYVFAGHTYFGHGGDINGFTQLTIHSEPDSVTLTLSINRNNAPRGPIAAAVLGVVFEQLSVGIAHLVAQEPAFSIHPNPANDAVFVETAGTVERIELLDAAGRVHWSERPSTTGTHRLALDAISPGTYLVRITQEGRISTRPLLVQ